MEQQPGNDTNSENLVNELCTSGAMDGKDIFDRTYPEMKDYRYVQKILVYNQGEGKEQIGKVEHIINDDAETTIKYGYTKLTQSIMSESHYERKNKEHQLALQAATRTFPHFDEDRLDIIASALRPHKFYCVVDGEPTKEDLELDPVTPSKIKNNMLKSRPANHSVRRARVKLKSSTRPDVRKNIFQTPATRHIPPDPKKNILKGAVCFVDSGKDPHDRLDAEIQSLGGRVNKSLGKRITHVFFLKNARYLTYSKARDLDKPLVTLEWLTECKKNNRMVQPYNFEPQGLEKYSRKYEQKKREKASITQRIMERPCSGRKVISPVPLSHIPPPDDPIHNFTVEDIYKEIQADLLLQSNENEAI